MVPTFTVRPERPAPLAGSPRTGSPSSLLRALTVAFLVFGVVVRVRQYARARSLWLDEIALADNILHRSWGGLLQPLAHDQGAPVGWLMLEKAAVTVVGDGEYGLRIISLLAGVALLGVGWDVARRVLPPLLVPVAVAALATAPFLIRYSSETKQYGTDALVLSVLTDIALVVGGRSAARWSAGPAAGVAVLGAGAVLVSHPANVVLVPILAVLVLQRWRRREWSPLRALLLASAAVGAVMLANYLLFLRKLTDNDALLQFWGSGLAPRPLTPGSFLSWLGRVVVDFVDRPLDLAPTAAVLVVLAVGATGLARRDPLAAAILAVQPLAMLAAGAADLVPFAERLVLGVVPAALLLLCSAPLIARRVPVQVVATAVVVALLAPGVVDAVRKTVHPLVFEDVRPILELVVARSRPGDVVLADSGAGTSVVFYRDRVRLDVPARLVLVSSQPCAVAPVLEAAGLTGHRVWYVTGHRFGKNRARDIEQVQAAFATVGARPTVALGSTAPEVSASATAYEIPAEPPGPSTGPCLRIRDLTA